jgi:hypothetical protein
VVNPDVGPGRSQQGFQGRTVLRLFEAPRRVVPGGEELDRVPEALEGDGRVDDETFRST